MPIGTSRRTSAAGLSLAQTLINYLPKQIVAGQGQIFDFGGELTKADAPALSHMYPSNTAVAELRFLDMIHGRN